MDSQPWKPAKWSDEEVGALQALYRGEALPHQQKLALEFIINTVSDTYGMHFHPNSRDTDFALGRAFVGQQVVKMLKLNLTKLRTGKRGENG